MVVLPRSAAVTIRGLQPAFSLGQEVAGTLDPGRAHAVGQLNLTAAQRITAATMINIGDTVTAAISAGTEAVVFKFDATAGRFLFLDSLNPYTGDSSWTLISQSGAHVR